MYAGLANLIFELNFITFFKIYDFVKLVNLVFIIFT
jgi:hypothetical protein